MSIAPAEVDAQNRPTLPHPNSPDPHSPSLADLRRRQREQLETRFDLLDETHTVAGRHYAFTRVADPEQVLDDVIAAEGRGEKGRMPYWAELWESALGIGEWLHNHSATVADRQVLDLGCGMGFAGMIAASLGGRVTFVDIEPDSLRFAEFNTLQWRDRVNVQRLDWQSDRLTTKFDLIIGADVLYERAQWDALEPFWLHHLAPGGTVLLGEPSRQTGESFPEWIKSCGWKIAIDQVRLEERSKTIRLFMLRR